MSTSDKRCMCCELSSACIGEDASFISGLAVGLLHLSESFPVMLCPDHLRAAAFQIENLKGMHAEVVRESSVPPPTTLSELLN